MEFKSVLSMALIGFSLSVPVAHASNFTYANWTTDTTSNGAVYGSASGSLTVNGSIVNIAYSGDVVSATQVNNAGTNYYSGYTSVYTNSTVSNLPNSSDVIALSEAQAYTDTVTFSTTVTDPILDIVSLGQSSAPVSYIFNATPILLSQGAAAYSGCNTCLAVSGNTLIGTEGDGVIEFVGNYSSLSWTTTGGEYWNGFTVGLLSVATPEPATWGTLLIATAFSRADRGQAETSATLRSWRLISILNSLI